MNFCFAKKETEAEMGRSLPRVTMASHGRAGKSGPRAQFLDHINLRNCSSKSRTLQRSLQ